MIAYDLDCPETGLRFLSIREAVLDVNNIEDFRDLLEKQATETTDDVALVLDDMTYLGSVALGMIALVSVMIDKRGGLFQVVCRNEDILKVFIVSGLYKVIRMAPSREAAAEAARRHRR